jgi:hypothetical protein
VKDSSVLDGVDPNDYMGDKGFAGNDMITPFRSQPKKARNHPGNHAQPPALALIRNHRSLTAVPDSLRFTRHDRCRAAMRWLG